MKSSAAAVLTPALPGRHDARLDALQHPSAVVRTAAQHWLVDASGAPHALLRPLLALLLSPGSTRRLQLYALAKLRAALASMPAGTLPLLAQQPAPFELVESCGHALDAAARRSTTTTSPRQRLFGSFARAAYDEAASRSGFSSVAGVLSSGEGRLAGGHHMGGDGLGGGGADGAGGGNGEATTTTTRRRASASAAAAALASEAARVSGGGANGVGSNGVGGGGGNGGGNGVGGGGGRGRWEAEGGGGGCSLLQLLAGATLAVVLQPPNPSSRARIPRPSCSRRCSRRCPVGWEALALTLSEPLFTCLQSSVAAEARGIQPQLLSLTYAALT